MCVCVGGGILERGVLHTYIILKIFNFKCLSRKVTNGTLNSTLIETTI